MDAEALPFLPWSCRRWQKEMTGRCGSTQEHRGQAPDVGLIRAKSPDLRRGEGEGQLP